jgi:Ser/Thr protein kinase RdoA (MazF antagonist)
VYQIGIEDSDPIIAKFYRPDRWSLRQINEEHRFTLEAKKHGLSVVAPLIIKEKTCFEYQGFNIAIFPRRGGRAPEIDNLECLEVLGRFIGRLHTVGASDSFKYRSKISVEEYGVSSRDWLLENEFLPEELRASYSSVTKPLLKLIQQKFDLASPNLLRLHADCHMGNVLWREGQPHFVDFDDARTGPAIQDLWMLLSGDEESQAIQMNKILKGYEDFKDFNTNELMLVEPLRALRLMYQAAWLARRWSDPAFPKAFPFFNTQRYWSEHILELREQWAAIEAPGITLHRHT